MYVTEETILNICHLASTWTMNTSTCRPAVMDGSWRKPHSCSGFQGALAKFHVKTRKKDRNKAFPYTPVVPWQHHLFPQPWRTSVLAHSTDSRQTDSRQTQWSTKVTFFSVLWSDNSLRKSYCTWLRGFSLGSERQKEKYHRGGLLCCCHEKNKEHFRCLLLWWAEHFSMCKYNAFILCSVCHLSFYLSIQTTFTLYVCDMTHIGGRGEVTGAENIKEMWRYNIFVFVQTFISFIYLHITLL